jgi:hypothetical protein
MIWVNIGEKPSEADLVNQMREAAKALGKSPEGFDTLVGSSNLLRNLLKDKSVLLILDDVWNAKHVSYFQTHGARFCRLLLTARNADIAKATGAQTHPLEVLTKELSRRLLANWTGLCEEKLPGEADWIIHECTSLPSALTMVASMLRDEPNSRWADVLNSLKRGDLEEIQIQFPQYALPEILALLKDRDTAKKNRIFISFKSRDANGLPTRDSEIAMEVYEFLTARGLDVFLSSITLEQLGVSDYTDAIDSALDAASVLVAIGTSVEHLNSRWVRYEWESFANDIRSNIKPKGRLFTYIEQMPDVALPRTLRQTQTFVHSEESLKSLFNFINRAPEIK